MDDRQETVDLVTFTEEILNGKLHFFVQWKDPVIIIIMNTLFTS